MNAKAIALCVLLAAANATMAQIIKGKVFDAETKEPIEGAYIQLVSDSNNTTVTKASGSFELNSTNENDSIKISFMGYYSTIVSIKSNLSISLKSNYQELQTIVVTSNRQAGDRTESPMAITKLSAKLIDETKPTQLYEIINKTPGVIMPNLNNEQHGMAIRQPMGYSAYYLYMEDGVPIRPLGVFNHNALLEVNQFAISSIEVVKGPASSIYGPEAVGGAVNFITQKPTSVPTAKLGVQLDNWGFRRVQFGAGAKIKRFGFYVGGLTSQQTNSWMTHSDYSKTTINTRLEYSFTEKTRLIGNLVYGDYYSDMSGNVDSTAFYNREYVSTSDFTYRKSKAYRSRLTLERDWTKKSKTFVTLFQRNNKMGQNPSYAIRWNPIASATNDPTTARGEINSNDFIGYGVIAQHSQQFGCLNSKLIVGGVYDYTNNDYYAYRIDLAAQLRQGGMSVEKYTLLEERPEMRLSNYKGYIKNYAGYLQYDFETIKKLRFSLGGRYDLMDLDYTNYINGATGEITYERFTPKVGATYDLGKNRGLYANYAQGFSPPSLTAIFRPRPNTNPVEFYTNLEPAVFQNYEVGSWIALWKNKITLDLSVYQMNGTNELLNIRQPDNSFDYQSAGRTVHRGVEFGLTTKSSKQIAFRFGGTTALHRYEDFQISNRQNDAIQNLDGFIMPNSPSWMWNSEWSYYPNWLKNFRTSIEWQYLSSWYENQINTSKYSGYNLLNYRIGYKWKGIEVYSNIMNLTNELVAFTSSRGNNPTDRTTYNPGAPRTFMFGLQYEFVGKK